MSTSVDQSLREAIYEFQSVLTPERNKELQAIRSVPDARSIIIFTAQLDLEDPRRKGRSIASRLHSILESIQQFSSIVGTFVSSHPEIAALVWGV
ncbi:hypothetical protein VTN00DRAFT_6152 [Thermoascus crustaceus]|uniref:uncharacterized protein n=1 Tax=Thermoascus crustaceus TaxID=5088 RepID=UPI003741EF9C